jgi:hypothetical protein
MDKLGKYLISDEEEPQPKTRKLKASSKTQNVIRKSSFTQVKINIYEPKYKNWIKKNNSKIYEFLIKVQKFKYLSKNFE